MVTITGILHEDLHASLQAVVAGWGVPTREIPAGDSVIPEVKGKILPNVPEMLRCTVLYFLRCLKTCPPHRENNVRGVRYGPN